MKAVYSAICWVELSAFLLKHLSIQVVAKLRRFEWFNYGSQATLFVFDALQMLVRMYPDATVLKPPAAMVVLAQGGPSARCRQNDRQSSGGRHPGGNVFSGWRNHLNESVPMLFPK